MWNYFKHRVRAYTSSALSFVKQNATKFSIAGIIGVITLLQLFGAWTPFINWSSENLQKLGATLISSWTVPIFIWWLLAFLLLTLFYFVLRDHWYLGKVAGEFYDDFKTGLSNWDYQGDWKIEEESGKQ